MLSDIFWQHTLVHGGRHFCRWTVDEEYRYFAQKKIALIVFQSWPVQVSTAYIIRELEIELYYRVFEGISTFDIVGWNCKVLQWNVSTIINMNTKKEHFCLDASRGYWDSGVHYTRTKHESTSETMTVYWNWTRKTLNQ